MTNSLSDADAAAWRLLGYFVHDGYCGWSYGTPADPQVISPLDAAELMRRAKLSLEQVAQALPPGTIR